MYRFIFCSICSRVIWAVDSGVCLKSNHPSMLVSDWTISGNSKLKIEAFCPPTLCPQRCALCQSSSFRRQYMLLIGFDFEFYDSQSINREAKYLNLDLNPCKFGIFMYRSGIVDFPIPGWSNATREMSFFLSNSSANGDHWLIPLIAPFTKSRRFSASLYGTPQLRIRIVPHGTFKKRYIFTLYFLLLQNSICSYGIFMQIYYEFRIVTFYLETHCK